ncbi:MAG: hypothetical protein KDC43_29420 [Saprospiraceae bacterium]|nr:hypothetical protein [Saprospiraceae bacterium]
MNKDGFKATNPYKIINMEKLDIINMLIGGVKPTMLDVKLNNAKISGTPKDPSIEWDRYQLNRMSTRFLLNLYRSRAHRKVAVK